MQAFLCKTMRFKSISEDCSWQLLRKEQQRQDKEATATVEFENRKQKRVSAKLKGDQKGDHITLAQLWNATSDLVHLTSR